MKFKKESSAVNAKSMYGSLIIGKCKYCGGKSVLAKGKYKTYLFCSHCDKVYKVKQQEIIAGSILLN